MERITLYEEYRLIEKTEPEVNGVWKGAHLLLFFLAFVFGSFCTFCFHMLMYLFDEKCVLFPKLLSLSSFKQNIIYEFIPEDKDVADMLPVDFLSTQWVEKSACLLPTYVPLVSGIFGLVWTTMFLMCSTGSRVLTGLQRPWRVLPPVFIFSMAMGSLCVYTSAVTHYGLQELCLKLSEITGSTTCTYTVNVATLAYERRIRGVYQATRLTIFSAWLHTACWVLSALLALARVFLAVDFHLIKVRVQLKGNIDRMLERHEKQIRIISPDIQDTDSLKTPDHTSRDSVECHFKKQKLQSTLSVSGSENFKSSKERDFIYTSELPTFSSELSLVPAERYKLDKVKACNAVRKEHKFIVKILYNVLEDIINQECSDLSSSGSSATNSDETPSITRQYGQQRIFSSPNLGQLEGSPPNLQKAEEIAEEIKRFLQIKLNKELTESQLISYKDKNSKFESSMNITSEMKLAIEEKRISVAEPVHDPKEPSTSTGKKHKKLKPTLKHAGNQTDNKDIDKSSHRVQIDPHIAQSSEENVTKDNKKTQTQKEKVD